MEFYNGQLKTAKNLKNVKFPKVSHGQLKIYIHYVLCMLMDFMSYGMSGCRDVGMSTENDKEAHLIVKIV